MKNSDNKSVGRPPKGKKKKYKPSPAFLLKVGDRLGTWEVKELKQFVVPTYGSKGRTGYETTMFALILSDRGQQRVLKADKKGLGVNSSERYYSTFSGWKFKEWNMM